MKKDQHSYSPWQRAKQRFKGTILIVEDLDADYMGFIRAINKVNTDLQVHRCNDGETAVNYLESVSDADLPSMILLDLNLPGMDGFELLQMIRAQERLQDLIVLVFSSSNSREEVRRAYSLGIHGYIRKPLDALELSRSIDVVLNYWFRIMELPR